LYKCSAKRSSKANRTLSNKTTEERLLKLSKRQVLHLSEKSYRGSEKVDKPHMPLSMAINREMCGKICLRSKKNFTTE
jgi:hypothetical protein